MGHTSDSSAGSASSGHPRCKACQLEKPKTEDFWELRPNGNLRGALCRKCLAVRKRELEVKRSYALAGEKLPTPTQAANSEATAAKRSKILALRDAAALGLSEKTRIPTSKLTIAAALKAGADVVNQEAVSVLTRIAEYANDPASIHHEWALKLFAERILPQRAFAALAVKEAGLENADAAGGPRISFNILPASGRGPESEGRVIDVERDDDDAESTD